MVPGARPTSLGMAAAAYCWVGDGLARVEAWLRRLGLTPTAIATAPECKAIAPKAFLAALRWAGRGGEGSRSIGG